MASTAGEALPTLGMRLDAVLSGIDQLPSSQLYGVIVAATVGLCVVLLGTGNSNALELQQRKQDMMNANANASTSDVDELKKPTNNANVSGHKQPKWHIFKWINYLAVGAFLWSVYTFCSNASQYLHHESQGVLVQFLVGWSVFLLYFFGFFGISLIHEDLANPNENENETTATNNINNNNISRYVVIVKHSFFSFIPTFKWVGFISTCAMDEYVKFKIKK
jgi:hypothetical protein